MMKFLQKRNIFSRGNSCNWLIYSRLSVVLCMSVLASAYLLISLYKRKSLVFLQSLDEEARLFLLLYSTLVSEKGKLII